eukprot:1128684-Alexandrium_andersonii.AAC.1
MASNLYRALGAVKTSDSKTRSILPKFGLSTRTRCKVIALSTRLAQSVAQCSTALTWCAQASSLNLRLRLEACACSAQGGPKAPA